MCLTCYEQESSVVKKVADRNSTIIIFNISKTSERPPLYNGLECIFARFNAVWETEGNVCGTSQSQYVTFYADIYVGQTIRFTTKEKTKNADTQIHGHWKVCDEHDCITGEVSSEAGIIGARQSEFRLSRIEDSLLFGGTAQNGDETRRIRCFFYHRDCWTRRTCRWNEDNLEEIFASKRSGY